jgi:hypothetical protein
VWCQRGCSRVGGDHDINALVLGDASGRLVFREEGAAQLVLHLLLVQGTAVESHHLPERQYNVTDEYNDKRQIGE